MEEIYQERRNNTRRNLPDRRIQNVPVTNDRRKQSRRFSERRVEYQKATEKIVIDEETVNNTKEEIKTVGGVVLISTIVTLSSYYLIYSL